jgi:7-cyano-7-deazaguanine synthase in queuosine biosynthesis
VKATSSERGTADIVLQPGGNLRTGENDFREEFGPPTTLERDLLILASAIFAADRSIERGEREYQNRSIKLSVPVVNTTALIPVRTQLEDILRTLSHDDWRIDFRQHTGTVEKSVDTSPNGGQTLLFSGGLDSLAAAIEFGRDKECLHLVSHVTKNQFTRRSQESLCALLKKEKYNVRHHQFFVSAQSSSANSDVSFSAENSQRTRSFLFTTLGALTARRSGHQRVILVAENGQLAVHLPLNPARAGAFSTHTAHPDVLAKMKLFFSQVLGVHLEIVNPFQQMTKAEVTKLVIDKLPEAIELSVSCWMNAHLPKGSTHCGYCIPCIIRRIAVETHRPDKTAYSRDLFSEDIVALKPSDDGRRNLFDFIEFNSEIERLSVAQISDKWPELIMLDDSKEVVNMYKRAAKESRSVFQIHPETAKLIGR